MVGQVAIVLKFALNLALIVVKNISHSISGIFFLEILYYYVGMTP